MNKQEKKINKEDLLIEMEILKKKHELCSDRDLERRKEFARAFGWNKKRGQYDYGDVELYEPTWVEVFVELGKLLNAKNFNDFSGNVSELEVMVDNLQKEINALKPKEILK